jgi:hypothetical protein
LQLTATEGGISVGLLRLGIVPMVLPKIQKNCGHQNLAHQSNCCMECGRYKKFTIKTIGSAYTQMHEYSQGLAVVSFVNCVIKVRPGDDLNTLIAMSRVGTVILYNVQLNGWTTTNQSLLPTYIFLRWISKIKI